MGGCYNVVVINKCAAAPELAAFGLVEEYRGLKCEKWMSAREQKARRHSNDHLTIHGHSPARASLPPTILPSRPACPHAVETIAGKH